MKKEIQWFASLCVKEGVLDEQRANQLIALLPDDADVESFAGLLLAQKITSDREQMGRLISEVKAIDEKDLPPPAPPRPAVSTRGRSVSIKATVAPTQVAVTDGKVDTGGVKLMTETQLQGFMLGLLQAAQRLGASDLHISAKSPIFVRRMRALEYLGTEPLTADEAKKLNTCLLSSDEKEHFDQRHDFDYALAMEGGRRIRANLMVQKEGVAGTYRVVPEKVLSLAELGFKNIDIIKKLLSYHNGLILVTGPVGSGKTATLNSLIDELNRTRTDHIITVEDPIEFLHHSQGCNVTQRQAGEHTDTFATALKSALREDPDVIVIGELRDLETIEMAITASETGHLVIGTMHTSDSTSTLNRILDVFPPSQQPQIRAMVAESLRGIICQRLLPAAGGGVVLACEQLVNTLAVSAMIRDAKTQGIPSALDTGKREGMISMDNAIVALWQEKKITNEVAAANITNRVIRKTIPGAQ